MENVYKVIEELATKARDEEDLETKKQLVNATQAYIDRVAKDIHVHLVAHAQQIIDPSEDRSEEEVDAKNESDVDVEGCDN